MNVIRQNSLLIIFIVILAGIFFIWYQYLRVAPSGVPQIQNEFEAGLNEIRNLKNLKLDTEILENAEFQALDPYPISTTTGLIPGRPNPFLPL